MNAIYLFYEGNNIRIPFYDYDKGLFNQLIKSQLGHWENEKKEYHVFRSSSNIAQLKEALEGRPYVEVGKDPDNPVIVNSFIYGGQHQPNPDDTQSVMPDEVREPENFFGFDIKAPVTTLDDQFPEYWRIRLADLTHARSLSPTTRKAYLNYNIRLCRWLQKRPEDVSNNDVQRYLAFLNKSNKAPETQNINLSAFKFFYGEVMKRQFITEQKRPRQRRRIPIVYSKPEIKLMLDRERNTKHRVFLNMVYGSGFRVSEAVKLKRKDVDHSRKVIMVFGGKGGKDRQTLNPKSVRDLLKDYYEQYNITDWLFPGAYPDTHMSTRTAQHIFKKALKNAGIEKGGTIHCLRHTFATHCIEDGYDISQVKELLGHNSIRTTEIYMHIAKKNIGRIISPLDTLDQYEEDDEDEEEFLTPNSLKKGGISPLTSPTKNPSIYD